MPATTAARERVRGELVAAALAGAWRLVPPPPSLAAGALAKIASSLLQTGCGGLAWWRARQAPMRTSAALSELRQVFRGNTFQFLRHERLLQHVLQVLRSGGVEPILVKGWSVARLYPEPGMRSCGDLDLCVRPEQWQEAMNTLKASGGYRWIDLHQGVVDLEDRSWEEVARRSRLVQVGEEQVRILGVADQLRHLCLHLMRHGAWRPLWLADVAAALESCPADFDWDYCLSGNPRLSEWVGCALGLAVRLLEAQVNPPTLAQRWQPLPCWLASSTLRSWGSDSPGDSYSRDTRPLASYWPDPGGLVKALCYRWPGEIEAVFKMRASPFTRRPKWYFQMRAFFNRFLRYPQTLRRARITSGLPFEIHAN